MNIQLVYNEERPEHKWIVWKRNVGKKYFGRIKDFSSDSIARMLEICIDKVSQDYIEKLSYDCRVMDGDSEAKWKGASSILKSDRYRKFTVKEYNALSEILLRANMRYNKKKDEFIK